MVPTRRSRIRLAGTPQALIILNKQEHPVFWNTILSEGKNSNWCGTDP